MKNEISNTSKSTETRPKRGRGGTDNFHNRIEAKGPDIQKALQNCLVFYDLPCVKTDEECRERLLQFFETCMNTQQLPTVEKMVMALGTVKSVVWQWEHGNGCSSERTNLIKKAKGLIATFEAELVTNGKINPVVYIFRAKNYFGMKDQQDVVVTPNNPLGQESDPKAIAEKYIEALPGDVDQEIEE